MLINAESLISMREDDFSYRVLERERERRRSPRASLSNKISPVMESGSRRMDRSGERRRPSVNRDRYRWIRDSHVDIAFCMIAP